MFIIAQIMGGLVLILTVISVHFKTKERVVLCFIFANIFCSIQYFLLGAITGGVISILNTIRCLVFYLYKKKNIKPSLTILLIFEIIAIISGIISWQNMWSIIPIVVTIVYTYGLWQDDMKVIRITTAIAGFGWGIYNIVVMAYVGAIQSISQLISSIIAIFRNDKNK